MDGFKEGYAYYSKGAGVAKASFEGLEYVDSVSAEINKLADAINSFKGNKKKAAALSGEVAEYWHSGTFNIDAAARGSVNRSTTLRERGLGSVDVLLDSGEKYGLKYYKSVEDTLREQTKTFIERYNKYASDCRRRGAEPPGFDEYLQTNADSLRKNGIDPDTVLKHDPLYAGQYRLVPADQYDGIKALLQRKIAKESVTRPELVQRYRDALEMLTKNIEDAEGNQSILLTKKDANLLAEVAKEGGFNPDAWELKTENLILTKYVLQQAFHAGLTSATVSIVLRVAPEIIKAILYLVDKGEIDREQFKRIGMAAVKGSAEGFVCGSISAAVTAACKAGLWGQALKSASPGIIGSVTVIVMDTMRNAFSVAIGKKSQAQMSEEMIHNIYVSACSLAFGSIAQGLLSELPVVGYLLGSFIGSFVGSITYSAGYKTLLSICVDTGFTVFGLVTQDYHLPVEIIDQLGITRFEPDIFEPDAFRYDRFETNSFHFGKFEPNQLTRFFLRRGMIDVRRVAYMCV